MIQKYGYKVGIGSIIRFRNGKFYGMCIAPYGLGIFRDIQGVLRGLGQEPRVCALQSGNRFWAGFEGLGHSLVWYAGVFPL